MRKLKEVFVDFMKRNDGPTAVEYAVALGLIVVVCFGALAIVGGVSSDLFTTTASSAGAAP
jgi:pilus assembly protein Flp/PilA